MTADEAEQDHLFPHWLRFKLSIKFPLHAWLSKGEDVFDAIQACIIGVFSQFVSYLVNLMSGR
jgi:hypothetical protein